MQSATDAQKPSFLFVPVVKSTMPLANKAVPKMSPATGIMTLVNRSCARHTHTHTHTVSRTIQNAFLSFARVNIASRHRSFDETKTHRAALLEVHEPLLALEKLHASSSHTAVRSSVCARDGRLAFYVVHARVSRRRPRSNPPRLDARDRSNPKLARAPTARALARASSRALALARDRRHRRVARTFCASTILSLMVDDRSIEQ